MQLQSLEYDIWENCCSKYFFKRPKPIYPKLKKLTFDVMF